MVQSWTLNAHLLMNDIPVILSTANGTKHILPTIVLSDFFAVVIVSCYNLISLLISPLVFPFYMPTNNSIFLNISVLQNVTYNFNITTFTR